MWETSQHGRSNNSPKRIYTTPRKDQIKENGTSNISTHPIKSISEFQYHGEVDKNETQDENNFTYQDSSKQQKYIYRKGTRATTTERNIHETNLYDLVERQSNPNILAFPSVNNKKIWNIESIKEINEEIPIESQRELELEAIKEIDDYLESHTLNTVNGYDDTRYGRRIDESPIVGVLAKDKSQSKSHSYINGSSTIEGEQILNTGNPVYSNNIEKVWNIKYIQEINETEKESEDQAFRKVDDYLESQITKKVIEQERTANNGTIVESPIVMIQATPRSKGNFNFKISKMSIKESDEQSNSDIRSVPSYESEKVWNIKSVEEINHIIPKELQSELEYEAIRKADDNTEPRMLKNIIENESNEYSERIKEFSPVKIQPKPRSKHDSNLKISNLSINEAKSQSHQNINSVQTDEKEKVWNIKSIHEMNEVFTAEAHEELELDAIKNQGDYMDNVDGHGAVESWQINGPRIDEIQDKDRSKSDLNFKIKDVTIKESYDIDQDIPSVDMVDDGNISVDTDSLIVQDEWVEYHNVPIELSATGMDAELILGRNKKPVTIPDEEDNISFNSNSMIMKEEWVEYHTIDHPYPTETDKESRSRSYENVNKNSSSHNLEYHEFLRSNSDIITDEGREFRKVPLNSLSPIRVFEDYDNSEISCIEPLDSSNHYTYLYENQSKTEKLRDLTNHSKHSSFTKDHQYQDSLSKRHRPMLFSTDCLKQTFHVNHEDEELLCKPIMYDAQGNMIENISETDNFKSINENVTVQIYEAKALIKIEITVEMFHNFRTDEAWKRKNVTLTRMIELDLLKIKDSDNLKDIMQKNHLNEGPLSWTDKDGNTVLQYKTENELKGKDLFLLFSNLMTVAHEEEERFRTDISNSDDFYLTSGPEGQMTSVSCEPQYLMAGFDQQKDSYLLY